MTRYFLTGATGFIGSRVASGLLMHPDCESVHVLIRAESLAKFAAVSAGWPHPEKVVPVVGDLAEPSLGIDPSSMGTSPDHVIHLAALYDIAAPEAATEAANVDGTRHALQFARACGRPVFHHVSSIAVAGDFDGLFTEADFHRGQSFPSAYHRTKHESERLVRAQGDVPYRIYRPSVVVGDSATGEMDKIDGPYYLLPLIARLARLPKWIPLIAPDFGDVNFVPVDYVVSSMLGLVHADAPSGTVYHLSSPGSESSRDYVNAFAEAMGAPKLSRTIDFDLSRVVGEANRPRGRRGRLARLLANETLRETGMPPEIVPAMGLPVRFVNTATRRALAELGLPTTPPPLREYADVLVDYWIAHLDPDRVRRVDPERPLFGKKVVVTGASSGIGRSLSLHIAELGAVPILIARRAHELDRLAQEIRDGGGVASCYPCDLTDGAAVELAVKGILDEHGHVDVLVNNAGRSIRRAVQLSTDRFHDYERTMSINFFAVVRLTLALLPSMVERQSGHIVNVTTQAVGALPPRWGAYASSKAAVDAFGMIAGTDLLADGVTVSNVRLPLVRTPMSQPSASSHRHLPMMDADTAARKFILQRAIIQRRPVVDALGGRLLGLQHMYNERLARTGGHLIAFQGMGETAPDCRDRNTRPPMVATVATAARLIWRAMARRPIRRM